MNTMTSGSEKVKSYRRKEKREQNSYRTLTVFTAQPAQVVEPLKSESDKYRSLFTPMNNQTGTTSQLISTKGKVFKTLPPFSEPFIIW